MLSVFIDEESMDTNPLRQYFRQPAIYIRLPSQGRFYPDGALERTENNEYPVLPMTTMDEITYRTPDALFNGSAVSTVIQSCVPNIKNAWAVPSIDIDTILIAIRIATYGHALDLSSNCPHCGHTSDVAVDLRRALDQIRAPDYQQGLDMGDLKIFFRPVNYREINQNSMRQFEDQKTMQMLQDTEGDDEQRLAQLGEILKKITEFTNQALAQSILMVQTPQSRVTERDHIQEWLTNCDRNTFNRIRDHVIASKADSELRPLELKCEECQQPYEQSYTLDMTTFFADAS
jgi:hypothetical protein